MKTLKIGLCVADRGEYVPIAEALEKLGAVRKDFYSREGHFYTVQLKDKIVELYSVLCGIGMVNAAAATTYLVDLGCEIIINTGYSGGISKVRAGQVVVGTKFIEHDFDLTGIGYKEFEKPEQDYVYGADEQLSGLALEAFADAKECVMLSGDRFISSTADKNRFTEMFDMAVCCDMETAAIAYVCSLAGVKYLSVRLVSDTASDDSAEEYLDSLSSDVTSGFADIVLKTLDIIA